MMPQMLRGTVVIADSQSRGRGRFGRQMGFKRRR